MKLFRFLASCCVILFSALTFGALLEIKTIKPFQTWGPDQIQEASIAVKLPKNFHLYKDQLQILNIKPDLFKSGEIKITPEVEFFDRFSNKNRMGLINEGVVSILLEAHSQLPADLPQIEFDLRHQICSEQVCYLPTNLHIVVPVQKAVFRPVASQVNSSSDTPSLFSNFENSLATNLPLAFLLVFLAGILTSFTPCIFPMLPITLSILGHHAETRTRMQNFSRSLVYVLGIATTYSILGVLAAFTGTLFGSALTNKYVLAGLSLLFVTMAFSMWGAFELQAPHFIRKRFGSGKSENSFEAYIMGLVAGIVASPCVGPVLISILTFVSASRNALLGFSMLFTFALGLGLLFIFIGLFGNGLKFLPRSGPWMNIIKFLLGACMWFAALHYLKFVLPERWWIAIVAASFVALSIWKGSFSFGKRKYLRQSFLLALFIFSTTVLLLCLVRPQYLSPAFYNVRDENSIPAAKWTPYSEQEIAAAKALNQPVLIDFYADWCGACHELDEKVFIVPEFLELSKSFRLLKVDATHDTEAVQKILKKYQVQGLPTVAFINRKGDLLNHLILTQFIEWNGFKPKMLETLK